MSISSNSWRLLVSTEGSPEADHIGIGSPNPSTLIVLYLLSVSDSL